MYSYSYLFFCVTPVLGVIRDYSKHKYISLSAPNKFIRTPVLYLIIYLLLYLFNHITEIYNHINILNILIYERWFMLIYKTGLSIYNNNHIQKHNKYKYKSLYKNKDLLYNNDLDIV